MHAYLRMTTCHPRYAHINPRRPTTSGIIPSTRLTTPHCLAMNRNLFNKSINVYSSPNPVRQYLWYLASATVDGSTLRSSTLYACVMRAFESQLPPVSYFLPDHHNTNKHHSMTSMRLLSLSIDLICLHLAHRHPDGP